MNEDEIKVKKSSKENLSFDEFPKHSYQEWKRETEQSLGGKPLEMLISSTYEDIDIKPIYIEDNIRNLEIINNSFPGFYPFIRGKNFSGNMIHPIEIAQELNYHNPRDFNKAALRSLNKGQTAIKLKITGFNESQQDLLKLNYSKIGLLINDISDFEIGFRNIDITKYPIYIKTNSGLSIQIIFLAYLKKCNIDLRKFKGGFEFDPLGSILSIDESGISLNQSYDNIFLMTKWAVENCPNIFTIVVDGTIYSNGGASAVEELGFSFSTAIEYIRQMQNRGLTIDEIAQRIRFNFSAGSNFFMEIAKFRAARLLWAKIIKHFEGNDNSQKINFHVSTTEINKSMLDSYTNILRSATEALSAIIGGCDGLSVSRFDEIINMPNEFSERIARNMQNVLLNECNLTEVIDSSGGSWFIESLTYSIAKKAYQLIQEVELMGGMSSALSAGFPQEKVAKTALKRFNNISTRKDILIGVNKSPNHTEKLYHNLFKENKNELEDIINEIKKSNIKKLIDFKTDIENIKDIINNNIHELIGQAILLAMKGCSYSKLEEVISPKTKEKVRIKIIPRIRLSENFEQLRLLSENYKEKNGNYPQVLLLNFGSLRDYKARNDFSTDFFSVGGFEVISSSPCKNIEEAIKITMENNYSIIVFCSSDAKYPEFVIPVTKLLKKEQPEKILILTGYPQDSIEEYKSAGIDEFIHIKSNIYDILNKLLNKINDTIPAI